MNLLALEEARVSATMRHKAGRSSPSATASEPGWPMAKWVLRAERQVSYTAGPWPSGKRVLGIRGYIQSYSQKLLFGIFTRLFLFFNLYGVTVAQSKIDRDKRRAERIPVTLPVQVGKRNGQTRDISVTGMYFETDESFAPGSEVDFSMDLQYVKPGGTVRLVCKGRIVRVERKDGRVGVAVAIDSYRFL